MTPLVRSADAADYAAFVSLFGQLGTGDPTPSIDRWTEVLRFHTLVAQQGDRVCGYVTFYAFGNVGHVRNLVVASDARGTGVGHALMRAAAHALRAAGATEWQLNVKADNAAAMHLYEKLGMRAEHRSTVVRLRWSDVSKLPAELATLTSVSPEEDDDIERAFAMPSGRLAMARRPGRIALQLRDRELAVIGVAVFDPEVPGAMPFRVARPSLAAPLLAALRAHARHDHFHIVVENHDELAETLIAAGADVRRRLLHYSGPLTTAPAQPALYA